VVFLRLKLYGHETKSRSNPHYLYWRVARLGIAEATAAVGAASLRLLWQAFREVGEGRVRWCREREMWREIGDRRNVPYFSFSSHADISNAAAWIVPSNFALAHFCESWHLQTSSYERTPDLAYYNYKSLSEQWRPIHGLSCCRAFSAS
jgi:hypothetical protein